MANATAHDQDATLERELAGLKADFEKLREEKVRAEQTLSHLESQLRELEEKALAEYGTADPVALERLLADMRAENARLVAEYRTHIQGIRSSLEALEKGAEG